MSSTSGPLLPWPLDPTGEEFHALSSHVSATWVQGGLQETVFGEERGIEPALPLLSQCVPDSSTCEHQLLRWEKNC